MNIKKVKEIGRFFKKVNVTEDENDCMIWNSAVTSSGYGRFSINKGSINAHLYIWNIHFDPPEKDQGVFQTCGNRLCVNIKHLSLETQRNNVKSKILNDDDLAYVAVMNRNFGKSLATLSEQLDISEQSLRSMLVNYIDSFNK